MAGLSYRKAANLIGLSSSRVQKLVNSGRIRKKDGKIDPVSVNAYLVEIGKAPMAPIEEEEPIEEAPPAVPEKEPVKLEPVSTAAAVGVRDILREAGLAEVGDGIRVTLTEAQTAKTIIQARLTQLKVQEEKGELVRKAFVAEQVFRWFRQERDAWQVFPARMGPRMAAELDVDPRLLIIALEKYVREYLGDLAVMEPPELDG